jgi:Leucine-rich repeat (LRR) protein
MKKLHFILIAILTALSSQAQTVYIPDANFKTILIELGVDTNSNGEIEYSEAEIITELNLFSWTEKISDLTGIEAFGNLEYLYCSGHNLSALDLSSNGNLKKLDCSANNLNSLNLTQ